MRRINDRQATTAGMQILDLLSLPIQAGEVHAIMGLNARFPPIADMRPGDRQSVG